MNFNLLWATTPADRTQWHGLSLPGLCYALFFFCFFCFFLRSLFHITYAVQYKVCVCCVRVSVCVCRSFDLHPVFARWQAASKPAFQLTTTHSGTSTKEPCQGGDGFTLRNGRDDGQAVNLAFADRDGNTVDQQRGGWVDSCKRCDYAQRQTVTAFVSADGPASPYENKIYGCRHKGSGVCCSHPTRPL